MSKIEIKDLYLIFGNEKQKALKMLKKDKSKEEILKRYRLYGRSERCQSFN